MEVAAEMVGLEEETESTSEGYWTEEGGSWESDTTIPDAKKEEPCCSCVEVEVEETIEEEVQVAAPVEVQVAVPVEVEEEEETWSNAFSESSEEEVTELPSKLWAARNKALPTEQTSTAPPPPAPPAPPAITSKPEKPRLVLTPGECSICFCDGMLADVHCSCGDLKDVCVDCWGTMVQEELNSGLKMVGCRKCFWTPTSQQLRGLLPNETTYRRYFNQRRERSQHSVNCGGCDCFLPRFGNQPTIHCITCRTFVCALCGYNDCERCTGNRNIPCVEQRLPATSDIDHRTGKKIKSETTVRGFFRDLRSGSYKFLHTKPCPKCNTPISKNGGCHHMTCTNPSCGHYTFCWYCSKRVGTGHYVWCRYRAGVVCLYGLMGVGAVAIAPAALVVYGGYLLVTELAK